MLFKTVVTAFIMQILVVYSFAATLQVGPNRQYKTPSAASAAAQDGDTIEIDAGIYGNGGTAWTKNNLKIRGVNGLAYMQGGAIEGKGIWVVKGKNTLIEYIMFSHAKVSDENGAGIRLEGETLTVSNCLFYFNQNGILTNNQGSNRTSDVTVEFSEFYKNGSGDGYTHNLYIGEIRNLFYRYNWSHGANIGHLLKSRAMRSVIAYNRLTDIQGGNASYELDFPNGGEVTIIGNILRQDALTDNSVVVSYGAEGQVPGVQNHAFIMKNNTLVAYKSQNFFIQMKISPSTRSIENNVFSGPGPTLIETGKPDVQSLPNNAYVPYNHFRNHAKQDYRLLQTSHAVNKLMDYPESQYAHPMSFHQRPVVDGLADYGALESGITYATPTKLMQPYLTGVSAPGSITLRWSEVYSDTHDITYNIFRNNASIRTQTQNTFSESLSPGQSYVYKIVVQDTSGQQVESNSISLSVSNTVSQPPIPLQPGWYELANTKMRPHCPPNVPGVSGCSDVISGFSSAIFDTKRNRLVIWGGGHNGYYGNELYALNLDTFKMERLTDPGQPYGLVSQCQDAIANGTQPNSRHTYDGLTYIEHLDKFYSFGGSMACGDGWHSNGSWVFDFKEMKWDRLTWNNPPKNIAPGTMVSYDPVIKQVFINDRNCLFRCNPDNKSCGQVSCGQAINPSYINASAVDTKRNRIWVFGGIDNSMYYSIKNVAGNNFNAVKVTTTGPQHIINSYYPGLIYDPIGDQLVGWSGGNTVYLLNLDTLVWTAHTFPGGPSNTPAQGGTYKRWNYSPKDDVFVLVNHIDQNAFVLRLPRQRQFSGNLSIEVQ